MRNLIISDIHANVTALEAVLNEAERWDEVWCLGDLVGYGPDPNECIERIRGLPNLKCILGNHDAAVIGKLDQAAFNEEAKQAIEWTRNTLTDESLAFLKDLPSTFVFQQVTLAHGSPRHPIWEYLLDAHTATRNFQSFKTDYCFVGHTHLPVIFYFNQGARNASLIIPEPDHTIALAPRSIINPGSVGQPRDRDPRAAYAIFNPEEMTWKLQRVAYDIIAVQGRMKREKLPEKHIQRLSLGW